MLSSQQKEAIFHALSKAFTTHAQLNNLISLKLNSTLQNVLDSVEIPNDSSSLKPKILGLIEWADSEGIIDDLIKGASHQRPRNIKIKLVNYMLKFPIYSKRVNPEYDIESISETSELEHWKLLHQKFTELINTIEAFLINAQKNIRSDIQDVADEFKDVLLKQMNNFPEYIKNHDKCIDMSKFLSRFDQERKQIEVIDLLKLSFFCNNKDNSPPPDFNDVFLNTKLIKETLAYAQLSTNRHIQDLGHITDLPESENRHIQDLGHITDLPESGINALQNEAVTKSFPMSFQDIRSEIFDVLSETNKKILIIEMQTDIKPTPENLEQLKSRQRKLWQLLVDLNKSELLVNSIGDVNQHGLEQ